MKDTFITGSFCFGLCRGGRATDLLCRIRNLGAHSLVEGTSQLKFEARRRDPPTSNDIDVTRVTSIDDRERAGQPNLARGSLWSLGALAAVAGGGFVFWVTAAFTSDAGDVGRAAAWFTLVQLIVIGSAIGAPILVNRRGAEPTISRISGAALAIVVGIAAVAGLAAPFVAGSSWQMMSGRSGIALSPLLMVGAVGAAATLVADARLMSLRRWRSVFARASLPAMVRLPLLLIDPLDDRGMWLAVIAVGPVALSGFVAVGVLARRGHVQIAGLGALSSADRRFLLAQHGGALATQAPYHVLPLMVAARVSGATNAAFYLVWGIGVMVAMLPQTLTQVLLSETSLDEHNRLGRIRQTLAANVALGLLGWLVSATIGRTILSKIGPTYGEISPILPWLMVAALAWGVTAVCLTEARLAHDSYLTSIVTYLIAFGSVGLALILVPARPVWGVVIAWVAANIGAMCVGMVAVERRWRSNRSRHAMTLSDLGEGVR